MSDNFKCLSSQVGVDAGLFKPCFFAFLAISISFSNITFILVYLQCVWLLFNMPQTTQIFFSVTFVINILSHYKVELLSRHANTHSVHPLHMHYSGITQ